MNRLIPAVFFQKQVNREKQPNGVEAAVKKPLVLDLYESEMREIVGGRAATLSSARTSLAGGLRFDGPPDGSGGTTTFSGSEGWLDVAQADDCGF
jgi:hypothetical protein